MKKNANYLNAGKRIDELLGLFRGFLDKEYRRWSNAEFEKRYGQLDRATYYMGRDIFLAYATNFKEVDFNRFYGRFGSPSNPDGKPDGKPVAWDGGGFLPDQMSDLLYGDGPFEEKLEQYLELYNKCLAIEKDFKKKLKRKPKKGRCKTKGK